MATRKKPTAKKVVKKTAAKKAAPKKATTKRAYTRKPKATAPYTVEQIESSLDQADVNEPQHDDRVDAASSSVREEAAVAAGVADGYSDAYVASLKRDVVHLSEQIEILSDALVNPKDLGRRLQNIGPIVFLDLQELNENKNFIGKALIAHLLGSSGYQLEGTDGYVAGSTKADSAARMCSLIKAEIIRLNTVNRTFTLHTEGVLDNGTQLYRIRTKKIVPEVSIEFARNKQDVVVIEGVTYRRS